jgi:hypothetical protein
MPSFTDADIRASFVNASRSERSHIAVPADLPSFDPTEREFVGWRDAKSPLIGYVVAELDGALTGVLLRQTEARPRVRTQCAWCADVELPADVVMFGARRAGASGRKGDTVGTLVCAHFECTTNVRRRRPEPYLGFDQVAALERRIEMLRANVERFVRDVRDSA